MKIYRAEIPDIIICDPTLYREERGYFTETFRRDMLEEFLGHRVNFCQDNEAFSTFGVLRGLHYQLPPFTQSKLVRVIVGKVLDVAVDIRRDSPTFGQHLAIELSGENKRQLFIPKGFAHGYVVLSDEAVFAYKVDNPYEKSCERGLAFNDVNLGIDWKLATKHLRLSEKDLSQPVLHEADLFEYQMKLYA
jgi:dTDP-4-dehydrorhamnose 3,5-epimerase